MAILMHGFMANKKMYPVSKLAKVLAGHGIASIRFDFNAHGDSEGKFEDMTISNEIEDAKAVFDYVCGLPYVSSIGFVGHSQGGVIAGMLAGILEDNPKKPACVVLLAPAAVLKDDAIAGQCMGVKYNASDPPEYVSVMFHRLGRKFIKEAISPFCSLRSVQVEDNSRETINIIDRAADKETEIIELGPTVSNEQYEKLITMLTEDICNGDIVICSGASIPGAPKDVYASISNICREKGALCFLDSYGKELVEARAGHSAFWKPNQNELSELSGMALSQNIEEIVRQVNSSGIDSERVLVSMGAAGGLLISKDGVFIADVPNIPVLSTIGCGDSTVAGFALAILERKTDEEAFRFAMAAGVANSVSKRIAVIDKAEVLEFQEKITVRRL